MGDIIKVLRRIVSFVLVGGLYRYFKILYI